MLTVSIALVTILLCQCCYMELAEKVLDSLAPEEALYNTHHCVYAAGHLFLFGQKGVHQPTYSNYRNTVLLGSYAIDVDLASKTFNRSFFSAIDKAEDRREAIFSLNDQVYMLTYGDQEICDFVELYLWESAVWKQVPMKMESKAKFGSKTTDPGCALRYTVVSSDSVLFALSKERSGTVIFSRLVVAGDAAIIVHLFTVESLSPRYSSVVFAGMYDDKIVAVPGSYGCGFRWHPEQVISVNLKQGTYDSQEVNTTVKPSWAFGGPLVTFQWKDKMLLIGGSIARGMTQMEFSREIWLFDMRTFTYSKSSSSIPQQVADFNFSAAFDPTSGILYLTDANHGVYKVKLEYQ